MLLFYFLNRCIIEESFEIRRVFVSKCLTIVQHGILSFYLKWGLVQVRPSIEEASNLYDESFASLKVANRHQNLSLFRFARSCRDAASNKESGYN